MKSFVYKRIERSNVVFVICCFMILWGCSPALGENQDSLSFRPFGNIMVYRQTPHPSQVVIFVSGDGGWNLGVIDMAMAISHMDALVLGIDFPRYQKTMAASKESCVYSAADFENLSKYAQKTLGLPHYVKPVLVGYSSGATLVYALLVQAPPNSYGGVVSLGFCPDLLLGKPLCHGNGLEWTGPVKDTGYLFSPAKQVDAPWIVFQGLIDQVCDPVATQDYVKKVGNGSIVTLPKVGHGFSVQKNWMPQFKEAFGRLFSHDNPPERGSSALEDLPLVEYPSAVTKGDSMAVLVSGDGGWADIDKHVASRLADQGIPVVGLNSLSYYWTARTPETASKDLQRIIDQYLTLWHKKTVVLVGYSFGADTLPFMISRLPQDMKQRIAGVALISPSHTASFEFHVSDWIGSSTENAMYPLMPEIEKLKDYPLVCMAGSTETDSLCKDIRLPWVTTVLLPGGHHLGGDYEKITQTILTEISRKRRPQ